MINLPPFLQRLLSWKVAISTIADPQTVDNRMSVQYASQYGRWNPLQREADESGEASPRALTMREDIASAPATPSVMRRLC